MVCWKVNFVLLSHFLVAEDEDQQPPKKRRRTESNVAEEETDDADYTPMSESESEDDVVDPNELRVDAQNSEFPVTQWDTVPWTLLDNTSPNDFIVADNDALFLHDFRSNIPAKRSVAERLKCLHFPMAQCCETRVL